MQITVGGVPGAGKTTIGKLLAKELGYDFYSIGSIRRKLASERGLTISEFNNLPENTDKQVDNYQKQLGEKEDDFVVEGRLAFYFIPNSVKFFFDCDLEVAAKRILKDQRDSEESYEDLQDSYKALKERMANDSKRYEKYYGLDCYDKKNFDHIIDTSSLTIEQVLKRALYFLENLGKKES